MNEKYSNIGLLLFFTATLIFLDQTLKFSVRLLIPAGNEISLIGGILKLMHTPNTSGFSWFVPSLPVWVNVVYQIVLLFIVIESLPVYLFYTATRRRSAWADIAFVGIVAAVVSHLLDSFASYTTDFLRFDDFPAANFADVYSFVGIAALIIEAIAIMRIKKLKWRGVRCLFHAEAQAREEFLRFIKNGFRTS